MICIWALDNGITKLFFNYFGVYFLCVSLLLLKRWIYLCVFSIIFLKDLLLCAAKVMWKSAKAKTPDHPKAVCANSALYNLHIRIYLQHFILHCICTVRISFACSLWLFSLAVARHLKVMRKNTKLTMMYSMGDGTRSP